MRLPKSVYNNLYFLLSETVSQLTNLKVLLETSSQAVAQRIVDREGYSYNLKMRVHDGCLDSLRRGQDDVNIFSLRAAEAIASDMERISGICMSCVSMMTNLTQTNAMQDGNVGDLLADVISGIQLIEQAIEEDDTTIALKISDIDRKLERQYNSIYDTHLNDVQKQKNPNNVITSLFIAKRIDEMGDLLRACGEAIMSAKIGQPMNVARYRSLKTALSDIGQVGASVETIAETKSGSTISGITPQDADGFVAIFKDGARHKLKEERESVKNWHEIYPGLAPQIISYKKQGKNAALLIEHLPGQTYEQALLQDDQVLFEKTMKHLCETLKDVWSETKRKNPVTPAHMEQLQKRLHDVFDVHPSFQTKTVKIGARTIVPLESLIAGAREIENKITAPFAVYIHGDFNLDNIIYDPDEKKIRFIDLHRSCYQDYTQDVSVFMVSNYRLQVLDHQTRRKISISALNLYTFAKEFAVQNKDKTFEIRLALGLARSFITSTRFILDKGLAKDMYQRGIYILERINDVKPKEAKDFQLPIEELFT